MSSLVPTKRQHQPNTLASGKGLIDYYLAIFRSSVGAKGLVAVTGLLLTGFVIVHLIGNLKLLAGRDSINAYAQFLRDLGPLLWIMRGGLLLVFLMHIVLAVMLKQRAAEARPIPYVHEQTIQASFGSRSMLYTGLVVLIFILFHIAHYTLGLVQRVEVEPGQWVSIHELKDGLGRHDVYTMVVRGFSNPLIAILYIIAQFTLLIHLSHGVSSVFQSLGLNSPRLQPAIKMLGWAVALFVTLGNIFLVVAVWWGLVKPVV